VGRKATQRAVLIGVNDYAFVSDLRYCGRDIEALHARLIAAGFQAEHVTLLQDGADESKRQPFKTNIERELNALFAAAGPDDLVLLAFSGHGVHLDGTSYFCPIEAQLDQPEKSLISLQTVYERLQACLARQKLLVVDACRNDPRQGGTKGIETPTETLDGFSRTLESPPEGILVFSSCKPGEVSFEDEQCRHGVFMNFVLKGLEGEADRGQKGNADGEISLLELYEFASLNTKTHVARTRSRVQTPVLQGKVSGDYDLAAALPSRPEELPSRFHRLSHQGLDNVLFTDPGVMSAQDPQVLLALRHAHQLLLPERSYSLRTGIPLADCDEALAALNKAISLEPTNAFAYLLRAIAYRKRGDYAEAFADYGRLNLPMELSVGSSAGLGDAELRVEDQVTGKVESLERLTVTNVQGDLVWVESVAPMTGRAAPDDRRRGWLHKQHLQPEIAERAAEAERYTSAGTAERLAERIVGRERLKPVDAQDAAALDALQRARERLGEARGGGVSFLRRDLTPGDCDQAIAACDEALKVEPQNRSALALRGLAYREKKDYGKALADFQAAEEPLTLVLRRRSVDLKEGKETSTTARLGDVLTISQVKGDWLWVAAVDGDASEKGWLSKPLLEKEETYTSRAFRSSSGTGGLGRSTGTRNVIRNEILNRARGYIPYGGWLPF
jgi:tetratricopeptide (TPR) repeat protein